MKNFFRCFAFLSLVSGCASTPWSQMKEDPLVEKPIIIAHRGASGYLPEHTIEAYAKAIEMGADYIEPDLVSTKDGYLIARHENEISGTTDVARKFPSRKTVKEIDGKSIEGYFTEDFTLAEIKTLRAKERLATRDHSHDGKFAIPTWEEVVVFVTNKSKELGRVIGIYPEAKHPTYFRSINLPIEDRLVGILNKYSLSDETSPIFIQSFEPTCLKRLSRMTSVKLVQLIDSNGAPFDYVSSGEKKTFLDMTTEDGLKAIRTYAQGVGPDKTLIVPMSSTGELGLPTSFVKLAHAQKLLVHPWTFRSDKEFLSPAYKGNPKEEYKKFFYLGVDGVFSDFSDTAVEAREEVFTQKK